MLAYLEVVRIPADILHADCPRVVETRHEAFFVTGFHVQLRAEIVQFSDIHTKGLVSRHFGQEGDEIPLCHLAESDFHLVQHVTCGLIDFLIEVSFFHIVLDFCR